MEEIETTGGKININDKASILKNICNFFGCNVEKIKELKPLQKGITNCVFSFVYNKGKYVYRHPGVGSDVLVNRGRESIVQTQATQNGIDETLLVMDVTEGWRISKYVENYGFDYHNLEHVVRGVQLIKKMHLSNIKVRWNFDVQGKIKQIVNMIPENFYGNNTSYYRDFNNIKQRIEKLFYYTDNDNFKKCLIHGDCRDENFLINDKHIYLIDWEYGGYGDPGFDLGTFICGGYHSRDEIEKILYIYHGATMDFKEKRHFYAYIAISGFFYTNWTMFKESKGQIIGHLKELWYYYANVYSKIALRMYEEDSE